MTTMPTLFVFAMGALSLTAAANPSPFALRQPAFADKSPSQDPSKQKPGDLYRRIVNKYQKNQLASINGREYKTMLKTGDADGPIEETLPELWEQIKTAATKGDYEIKPSADPQKVETSTKEYLDTPKQDLWRAGYLIRISTKIINGTPDQKVTVTIKSIKEKPTDTIKTKLKIPDDIVRDYELTLKKETQENISFFPSGMLNGYVEKGVAFSIDASKLGNKSLGVFGKFLPELLDINEKIDLDQPLKSTTVYASKIVPGNIKSPDLGESPVYIEAWSKAQGEKPFVIDFSFGYETPEYYKSEEIQTAGEKFMLTVVQKGLKDMIDKDSGKFGGSKVRLILDHPIKESKKSRKGSDKD